jgi:T-complex protein 1 subunit delta
VCLIGFGMERETSKESASRTKDVRVSNIMAAKAVFDTIRTSLGPRGMDKMVIKENGDVLITNDGATIMKQLEARHPAAKMLVELSQSQDIEAGDGTTTVVVIAGSLLNSCLQLFKKGVHAAAISEGFLKGRDFAQEVCLCSVCVVRLPALLFNPVCIVRHILIQSHTPTCTHSLTHPVPHSHARSHARTHTRSCAQPSRCCSRWPGQ